MNHPTHYTLTAIDLRAFKKADKYFYFSHKQGTNEGFLAAVRSLPRKDDLGFELGQEEATYKLHIPSLVEGIIAQPNPELIEGNHLVHLNANLKVILAYLKPSDEIRLFWGLGNLTSGRMENLGLECDTLCLEIKRDRQVLRPVIDFSVVPKDRRSPGLMLRVVN